MSQVKELPLVELAKSYQKSLNELLQTVNSAKSRHIDPTAFGIMINRQFIEIREKYNTFIRANNQENDEDLFGIISESAEILRTILSIGQGKLLSSESYLKIISQFNMTINLLMTRKDTNRKNYYYSLANFLSNLLTDELKLKGIPKSLLLENMNDFSAINAWTNVLNSSTILYFNVAKLLPSIFENNYIRYISLASRYISSSISFHPSENFEKEIKFNKNLERDSYGYTSIYLSWLTVGNQIISEVLKTYSTKIPDDLNLYHLLPNRSIIGFAEYLEDLSNKFDKYHNKLQKMYETDIINKNLGKPSESRKLKFSYIAKENYRLAIPRMKLYNQFSRLDVINHQKLQDIDPQLIDLTVRNTRKSISKLLDNLSSNQNIITTGLSSTYIFLFTELINISTIHALREGSSELYYKDTYDMNFIHTDEIISLVPELYYLEFLARFTLETHLNIDFELTNFFNELNSKIEMFGSDVKLYVTANQLLLKLNPGVATIDLNETDKAGECVKLLKELNFSHLIDIFKESLEKKEIIQLERVTEINPFDPFTWIIPNIESFVEYTYTPLNLHYYKLIRK